MANEKIDWESIVGYHNNKNNSDLTVRDFLQKAYDKTGNIGKTAETIGVSYPTMNKYLKVFKIKVERKIRNPQTIEDRLLDFKSRYGRKAQSMTIKEIMKHVQIRSRAHAYCLLKKNNIQYTKVPTCMNGHSIKEQFLKIKTEDLRQFTAQTLAKRLGSSENYAYVLLKREKMEGRL